MHMKHIVLFVLICAFTSLAFSQAPVFDAILAKAKDGDANAQKDLGGMYVKGEDAPKDITKGIEWLRKSADQKNAEAQCMLGDIYFYEDLGQKDIGESLKWYQLAADQGHARAQFRIGLMHAEGIGVVKDGAEAIKWLRKAADQEHTDALCALGILYSEGKIVQKNTEEGLKLYRKASDQGDATAQFYLGKTYLAGIDVKQNFIEASKWLRKSADQGEPDAQYLFAMMYYSSDEGLTKNELEAAAWLYLSEGGGNQMAGKKLTEIQNQHRPDFAVRAQQRAVEILKVEPRSDPELQKKEAAVKAFFLSNKKTVTEELTKEFRPLNKEIFDYYGFKGTPIHYSIQDADIENGIIYLVQYMVWVGPEDGGGEAISVTSIDLSTNNVIFDKILKNSHLSKTELSALLEEPPTSGMATALGAGTASMETPSFYKRNEKAIDAAAISAAVTIGVKLCTKYIDYIFEKATIEAQKSAQ